MVERNLKKAVPINNKTITIPVFQTIGLVKKEEKNIPRPT